MAYQLKNVHPSYYYCIAARCSFASSGSNSRDVCIRQRRCRSLVGYRRLHRMQDFDSQEVKVCPAKHTPLNELETIDVSFDDPIAPRQRASGSHSSVIPTNASDKAA